MNEDFSADTEQGRRPSADRLSGNGQRGSASSDGSALAILLIDDNPAVAGAMEIAFRMAGHRLDMVPTPQEAFSRLARQRYDAVLLDLNFSAGQTDGREGLACLARIKAEDPAACVVVLTAHGGIRTAVAAMQAGARDFAMKPWKNADLIAKVEQATRATPVVPTRTETAQQQAAAAPPRLLGESASIEALRALIRRIGPTMAGVVVTGPSGAGRNLTAQALHAISPVADTPPLRLDLRDSAIWEDAALEQAEGTVILLHPDRLDPVAQDRLAVQLPMGSRPIGIADSLAPLTPALRRRIATVELAVPPIAARRGDIAELARHFLTDAAERFGRPIPVLTEAAEQALLTADWPDEVRGLALAMERAVLLAEYGVVDAATLSLHVPPTVQPMPNGERAQRSFDLERSEKAMIEAALREHHHNVSLTAQALGLSRGALYRRMERHGL